MRKSVLLPLILLVALVIGSLGYAVADAYNLVPGILTIEKQSLDLPQTVQIDLNTTKAEATKGINEQANQVTPEQLKPLMDQLVSQAQHGVDNKSQESASPDTNARAGAVVIDTASGKTIAQINGNQLMTPASSSKIIAAATALDTLGAQYRFTTSTHFAAGKLYLRGNGDQLLSPNAGNPAAISGHAGLGDLAAKTAKKLKAQKVSTTQLFLDESIFGDQNPLPNWKAQGNDRYESKPTPIAINNGLANPQLSYGYLPDPALSAAQQFAQRMKDNGISVEAVQRGTAPKEAAMLAEVKSAALHEIVHETLKESNNMLAEVLCRASAAKIGSGTNFAGQIKAAQKVLKKLHIESADFANQDCSGLSTEDRIKPALLAAVMQKAATGSDSQLRPIVSSLPIGALDGTLDTRYSQQAASGNVRAKTGSLQRARSLTGLVTTKSGRTLTFAVIIDSYKEGTGENARAAIDNFVNGLASL